MKKTRIEMSDSPLVSVVVPVYNMEKHLNRCVDSILQQTYSQLEIILVDDCSTDSSAQIMKQYADEYKRVKTVWHEKNRGLFQARVTGSKCATGKYIAFVDSDDHISIDWFRTLVRKAESMCSDITVGEWCFDFNGAHQDYCNMDHFRLNDYVLEEQQILDQFMAVEGRNLSWTAVWNKLYSMELWERCIESFEAFSEKHGHMLICEDIVFSSGLWMQAKRVTNVHGVNYFHLKHEYTPLNNPESQHSHKKKIYDVSGAIAFMEETLKATGNYQKYMKEFQNWTSWCVSLLYKNLVIDQNKHEYAKTILDAFNLREYEYTEPDQFFYSITTPLHASFYWLEALKNEIASPMIKYVSFDIFDTLILRPFFYPTDIFQLVSELINRKYASYVNFKVIREAAEHAVRKQKKLAHPSDEEITLDEIYNYIQKHYIFDCSMVSYAQQTELDLELQYCTVRNSGKELLDFANECGKKVIICSDMYLPGWFVEKILKKNGITNYEKLYLSSEIGLTKARKSLYKFVQRDLKCKKPGSFLHIGDNWISDVENAKVCGWHSMQLSKSTDLLFNLNPAVFTGEAFQKLFGNTYFMEDYRLSFNDFTSIRTMAALTANKFFNSPFVSFNSQSDFGADPRMVGYAALGPHLLALCHWIHKNVTDKKIGTVHFVARDGFLIKKAYDTCFPDSKTNYLRLSRKALILCDIQTKEDIYSLYNKMKPTASPKEFSDYLMPIIPKEKREKLPELFKKEGFQFKCSLKSISEWADCLKIFAEQVIDLTLLPPYKEKLKRHFAQYIKPGDFIFDVGYSGRPESALSSVLGFPVGSMYIHVNGEIAGIRQEKFHCPHEVFYNFKPSITCAVREHLLMELAPSTTGFQEINDGLEPVLEPYVEDYCSAYVTRMIQDNALQFVQDYQKLFNSYQIMYNFQYEVACATFEYYMHCSKHIDREILSPIPFEDDIGGGGMMRILDFWDHELAIRNIGIVESNSNTLANRDVVPGLDIDGYLMKFVRLVNKLFPRGSRMREFLKKIASIFEKIIKK